jgi:hypothetical protein
VSTAYSFLDEEADRIPYADPRRLRLADVPPGVWLSKPLNGKPARQTPIADLPLMQLVNIVKRFVAEARASTSLDQTIVDRLAEMALDLPQLRVILSEAQQRPLIVWPEYAHQKFVAALMALEMRR